MKLAELLQRVMLFAVCALVGAGLALGLAAAALMIAVYG